MKKLILVSIALFIQSVLLAQDFNVPDNYKFDKKKDYAKYQEDVLKGIDWLLATPVNEQVEKRKNVNAFVLQWMTGSPDIQLELKAEIVSFEDGNLLIIFLGGWTKYAIKNNDFKDKKAGTLAGLETVIDFYVKNKANMPADENVDKYIKMKEEGTLKEYVNKNA